MIRHFRPRPCLNPLRPPCSPPPALEIDFPTLAALLAPKPIHHHLNFFLIFASEPPKNLRRTIYCNGTTRLHRLTCSRSIITAVENYMKFCLSITCTPHLRFFLFFAKLFKHSKLFQRCQFVNDFLFKDMTMHTCTHICMQAHTYVCVYIYLYKYTYTHTLRHVYVYINMYTYIKPYIYIDIHSLTHHIQIHGTRSQA